MKYPQIDLSEKSFPTIDEFGIVNIGYYQGELTKDGRPFRVDAWELDGVLTYTYYISNIGMEKITDDELHSWLEKEGLYIRTDNPFYVKKELITDSSNYEFLVLNVYMGNENSIFVRSDIKLLQYNDQKDN